jgi:hypothetical protein
MSKIRIRPSVAFLAGVAALLLATSPGSVVHVGMLFLDVLAAYLIGVRLGRKLSAPAFAADATDAGALVVSVLCIFQGWLAQNVSGLPNFSTATWFPLLVFFGTLAVILIGPQLYAYARYRLRAGNRLLIPDAAGEG